MNIREPTINAVGAHGEFLVINAEQMQDGGVHVIARGALAVCMS